MNTVPAGEASTGPSNGPFCGHCGNPDGGGLPASDEHRRCVELLTLEPPRYCAHCRRRMKVQVTPTGWSAQCSRHSVLLR